MPTILLHESVAEAGEIDLLHPDTGELTIEAQVLADFLTHLDLSAVSTLTGVEEEAEEIELEEADGEKTALLPGWLAAAAVDEEDLQEMFRHYVNGMAARIADDENATLEQKTHVAPFVDLLDEKYAKGAFRRMHKQPAGHNRAARQLTAMLYKGVVRHVARGKGQGYNKDYVRDRGYKSGGTVQGRKKVALWKGKSSGKLKKAAVKARQKFKEDAAAKFDVEATPVWGMGEPVESVGYVASLHQDAQARVDEARKSKGKKARGMPKAPAPGNAHPPMDTNSIKPDDDVKGARRTVAEGAVLAGQMLKLHEIAPTPTK